MSVIKGKTWQLLHGASWNVGACKNLPTSLYLLCSNMFISLLINNEYECSCFSYMCFLHNAHLNGGWNILYHCWHDVRRMKRFIILTLLLCTHDMLGGGGVCNGKLAHHVFGEEIFLSPQCSNLNFKYGA